MSLIIRTAIGSWKWRLALAVGLSLALVSSIVGYDYLNAQKVYRADYAAFASQTDESIEACTAQIVERCHASPPSGQNEYSLIICEDPDRFCRLEQPAEPTFDISKRWDELVVGFSVCLTALFALLTTVAMFSREPSGGWRRLSIVISGGASALTLLYMLLNEGGEEVAFALGIAVAAFPLAMFAVLSARRVRSWVREGFLHPTADDPIANVLPEIPQRRIAAKSATQSRWKWILYTVVAMLAVLTGLLTMDYATFVATVTQVLVTVAIVYPLWKLLSLRDRRKKQTELQALADELAKRQGQE